MDQCIIHRQHSRENFSSSFFDYLFIYCRIYVANKMFDWTMRQGGLKAMNQQSNEKSSVVYQVIDQSNGFYVNSIDKKIRSRVNIPLRIVRNGIPDEKLESLFINEAVQSKMFELKGHRAVGGLRISLYNGISLEDTNKLIHFMRLFQTNNG